MKNYIQPGIILLLAVLLLLAVQKCSSEANHADINAAALTDTVKHFRNKLGTTTASIKTLQLDKKQMKDLLLSKDKDLAELSKEFVQLHSVTKAEAEIIVKEIPIVYRDTVPCVFERTGAIKTDWYSFGYLSNQKGLQIDSLKAWTSVTAITGTKRKWFLGKETVTTDITFSNPNIMVTDLKAAELTVPSPWYKKWYVWLAIGAAGGIIIAK